MSVNIEQYLIQSGWEYKHVGSDELRVKICPLCFDDRWKFYINTEGLWNCKVCGKAGNFYQLKANLGELKEITSSQQIFKQESKPLDKDILDKYVQSLWTDRRAIEYLEGRGFKEETIKHFRIGLEGDWILIPHIKDGELWNFKKRNFLEKKFKRIKGQPTILFNGDNINFDKPSLVIVESETDCMAAWQMGLKNVVALTAGAETFPYEWVALARQFKKVFICLNSDEPGQRGAYKIAEKVGLDRCRNIILPTNDVNDFLQEHSKEEFVTLFGKSTQFNLENITDLPTMMERIDDWFDDEGNLAGLHLEFQKLDSYLDGLKAEDLIIVSGDTAVGKTTFSLNILHQFLRQGKTCLAFLLEGKLMYYILRMMSIEMNKSYKNLRDDPVAWEKAKKTFATYPLYFYTGTQADMGPRKLRELLPAAVKLYDVDFVMVDNLQKYVRGITDIFQKTSSAVTQLKDLAVDLKIPILLISHIRKPSGGRKRVTMHDAKSSSTIYQDADVYITLWAKDEDMVVSLEKNRMGEGGKDVFFKFDKVTAVFREKQTVM